jgi:hypothetical protein
MRANHMSRRIWDLLESTTLERNASGMQVTLAQHFYDQTADSPANRSPFSFGGDHDFPVKPITVLL